MSLEIQFRTLPARVSLSWNAQASIGIEICGSKSTSTKVTLVMCQQTIQLSSHSHCHNPFWCATNQHFQLKGVYVVKFCRPTPQLSDHAPLRVYQPHPTPSIAADGGIKCQYIALEMVKVCHWKGWLMC